jgi:dTDP-glucose pyrophosphorylase/CBS domain-containing protein
MISQFNLKKLCISPDDSLYRALESIDKSGADGTKLALVVDSKNRLTGILNDGDVRRALLNHASLDAPVADHMRKDFTYAEEHVGRAAVLQKMKSLSISQVPIVNKRGEVVGLHLLSELIATKSLDVTAVIMAGGKGTRLRPITENLPKPMVRVAGQPILEHLVHHLVGYGVRDIFLSVNYMAHVIEDYFGDGTQFGCNIYYLREERPLGTAGALSLLPRQNRNLLLMNGDLITQFDVSGMLDIHTQKKHAITVGVRDYVTKVPYGVIEEKNNQVVSITEKPTQHHLINGGVYVIAPELLELIPQDTEFFATDLIETCFTHKLMVGSHLLEEDWLDVGEHEQLQLARGGQ